MSSIQGIDVNVTFVPPVPFTDEWIDAIYASLEKNMAIVSIDMFVQEDQGEIRFVLGVENPFGSDDFTSGVAKDAVDKALLDAAGPNKPNDQSEFRAGKVEVFA